MKKLRHFLYFFNPFFAKWGNITWKEIDEIKIENYITERLKDINPKTLKNITEKSIKNELKYLRAVWNFLLRNGYLTGINYADKILKERQFEEKKRERALSYQENVRFLKGIIEIDEAEKKGILLIGYFTGARLEEILKLRKEHIRIVQIDDIKEGLIHFTPDITKTGKSRKIDIPYQLALFLLSISTSNLLFPSYQTEYKKRKFSEWFHHEFLKKCNIENFVFHDLRHNWATIAEDMGTSLRIIKELGGWESFESVDRYINPLKEKKNNPMKNFVNNIILELKEKKLKELEENNEM
ncbi:MAG: tyrosine-type recombinase/integrase [Candidatus Hydrothermales bacterium]